MLKKILAVWIAAAGCGFLGGQELVRNSVSEYQIYCAEDAIPAEQTAAKELQVFLQKITGAELPVVSSAAGKKIIYVGPSAQVRKILKDVDFSSLEADEILLKTAGDSLILAGGRPRGTLYAVYEWLERLGVRFFAPDETRIPRKNTLVSERMDERYAPKLKIREILYNYIADEVFAARMRSNGHWRKISPAYGGHNRILGFCHTFDALIPAKEFLAKKPEWFSWINGERRGGQLTGQLCLSNDEMRAELTRRAAELLRRNPGETILSISQNDNKDYCQCPECSWLDEAEGTPAASVIRFVNRVADDLRKEFPDVIVETLAYTYSRKPPKTIRPGKNILVRLCSIELDFAKPMSDPANAKFRDDLTQWGKIASRLCVWNYTANYSIPQIPYPNLEYLGKDIRVIAQYPVHYLFQEGNHSTRYGDLTELHVYLLSRLMWNPAREQEALTEEFLNGYYKNAAPFVRQYLDLRKNELRRSKAFVGCYSEDTSAWLSLDGLRKARALIAEAEKLCASDPRVRQRLGHLAFSLDFALLLRSELSPSDVSPAGTALKKEVNAKVLFDSVSARAHQYRTLYGESCATIFQALERAERQLFRSRTISVPDFCKDLPAEEWMEFQEDVFRWPNSVRDSAASNGKARKMSNAKYSWTTQCTLPVLPGNWRIYAAVRCEGNPDAVFSMAIYNQIRKTERGKQFRAGDYPADRYRWIAIGPRSLSESGYLFLASGAGVTIYTDRIILVREK